MSNHPNNRPWFEIYATPLSLIISILIATGGWIYTSEQNRINKLREIKNQYISDAYSSISFYNTLSNYNLQTKQDFINFQQALKNIQLYGTKEEINLLLEYISKANQKGFSLDPLLNKLRNNLRNEYGLKPLKIDTWWIIDTSLYYKSKHFK